jgi:glycine cleavage system H lipoate-binding protein
LRERLVQYCDAAQVRTYIPFIHGLLSRCQNSSFRYCPLYLQRERPEVRMAGRSTRVHDLLVATDRSYTRNHFWIEEDDFGLCHIGVDPFVTHLLDRVDVVHYISRRGLSRPHVVLGNDEVQLDLLFPERLEIAETNAHLRCHPETLHEDPYGAGWLFEGQLDESSRRTPAARGFVDGCDAGTWMQKELCRLDDFVHDELLPSHTPEATCADGGQTRAGLTRSLSAVEIARLFHEFFRTPTEVESS